MPAGLFKAPTANYVSTSLNGAINDSVQTITLSSTTNMQAPGYVVIDREDGNGTATPNSREVIKFTGISSNDLTGCTRGADSSTARSHSDGALVETMFTVGMHNDQRDAINAEHDTDGTHTIISAATITQAWVNNAHFANATINALDAVDIVSSEATVTTLNVGGILDLEDLTSSSASIALLSAPTLEVGSLEVTNSAPYMAYGFRAHRSSDLSNVTTNLALTLQLGTESYDRGGVHNTSTGIFTPPVDGFYDIQAAVNWKNTVVVADKRYGLRFNSTASGVLAASNVHASHQEYLTNVIADTWYLDSGDTYFLSVFHTQGTNSTISGGINNNWWAVKLVGI